jgi:hypothetical protein
MDPLLARWYSGISALLLDILEAGVPPCGAPGLRCADRGRAPAVRRVSLRSLVTRTRNTTWQPPPRLSFRSRLRACECSTAKAGGCRLRPKAGSIGHAADYDRRSGWARRRPTASAAPPHSLIGPASSTSRRVCVTRFCWASLRSAPTYSIPPPEGGVYGPPTRGR